MCIEQRVRMCRLVEKIKSGDAYSRKIGITDVSTYRGEIIKENKKRVLPQNSVE